MSAARLRTKIDLGKIRDDLIKKKANDDTTLDTFCDFVKKTGKVTKALKLKKK